MYESCNCSCSVSGCYIRVVWLFVVCTLEGGVLLRHRSHSTNTPGRINFGKISKNTKDWWVEACWIFPVSWSYRWTLAKKPRVDFKKLEETRKWSGQELHNYLAANRAISDEVVWPETPTDGFWSLEKMKAHWKVGWEMSTTLLFSFFFRLAGNLFAI